MTATDEKQSAKYALPSEKTIAQAGELTIQDEKKNTIKFSSLYTDKPEGSRQMIVFIRHFFCGNCEEYVRTLGRSLSPATLAESNATLTLIGCGDPSLISDYKARTNCPFELYADPSRGLYRKLEMVSALKGGPQPEYMSVGILTSAWKSFLTAAGAGAKALKSGPASQNGGEWLFTGGELKWCHRMNTTMDHAEVKELKEALGIEK